MGGGGRAVPGDLQQVTPADGSHSHAAVPALPRPIAQPVCVLWLTQAQDPPADAPPPSVTRIRHTVPVSTPTAPGELLAGALRAQGRPVHFRRGHALFTEGDVAERVFIIERGWVLISSVASSGREIVLGIRGPGDVIGDLSALDGAPRSASALAVGDVEATVAPGVALTRALTDAATAMELLRILAARLRDSDRKRLEFAALDTLGRVAWRLQELGERFGEESSEGVEVELPLSQEQLASWCGASREATVKALAALRSLGCIATGRRSVLIRDAEALRRHARGAV